MDIYVNGDYVQFNALYLSELVVQLKLQEKKGIALALNEEIISKSEWSKKEIKSDDKILIITATQGG